MRDRGTEMIHCLLVATLLMFFSDGIDGACRHCGGNLGCDAFGECAWCKPGRWGPVCNNPCASNCTSCAQKNGGCWKCRDADKWGWYCELSCSNCMDENYCFDCNDAHSCKSGFYGRYCSDACPVNCKGGTCNTTSGDCDNGCINGYYGNKCQNKCPTNCVSCASELFCDSCKPGYANLNDITTCGCKKDICIHSSSIEPYHCDQCYFNYWYPSSTFCCPCNYLCKNHSCASDGSCTSGCIGSYYGRYCDKRCYENISYCFTCAQPKNDVLCKECFSGYYLASSSKCRRCSQNCIWVSGSRLCNSHNGNCTSGCKNGYYFHKGHEVDVCQKCSANCVGETTSCRSYDGYCVNGCNDGYYGYRCNLTCPDHCVMCERNTGQCLQCNPGYYGINCGIRCNENCKSDLNGEKTCDKENGTCSSGCEKGYYGQKCTHRCHENCKDHECDILTGRCIENCSYEFYGDFCDLPCNEMCLSGHGCRSGCDNNATLCSRDDGYCTYGCRVGAFGRNCSEKCSSFCKNQTCYITNGTCVYGCIFGYKGDTCNQAQGSGEDESDASSAAAIVGAVVGAIVAVAIVVAVLLFMRRRKDASKADQFQVSGQRFQNDSLKAVPTYSNTDGTLTVSPVYSKQGNLNGSNAIYEIPPEINEPFNMLEVQDEGPDEVLRGSSENGYSGDSGGTYYNMASMSRRPVAVKDIWNFIKTKTEGDFNEEFKRLPKGLVRPHNDAVKPENIGKNRYKLVYPYDDTRVILGTTDGSGDFINASYIDHFAFPLKKAADDSKLVDLQGFEGPNQYIASLGPIDKTVNDFWRMVWQENTGKIVMLTNPLENGKMKCITYWPNVGRTMKFGNLSVSTQTEDVYADFAIRQLALEKVKERRTVYQFHFTAWPDRGVPDDVTGLIEFRDKVNSWQALQNGPIVVHCSAGIGRTGTFLVLDYLTLEGEHDGAVDIFGCLVGMRHQRVGLVQTQEQYRLLHFAVNQSLWPETRPVSSDRFPKYFEDITESKDSRRHIKSQFERLDQTDVHSRESKERESRNNAYVTKTRKCRCEVTPLVDRYRLRLYLDITDTNPGSDYINAVFIDSHKRKNAYISTQSPLPGTMEDFFRLIFQQDVSVIIALNEITGENSNIPLYWPAANEVLKEGNFTVNLKETEKMDGFIIRQLTIQYKAQVKTVTQFCATFWTESQQVPPLVETFLRFIEAVDNSRHSSPDIPTAVHCLDGTERTGLYCSVANIIEKLKTGQEVSVANTVRQIRARRQNAVGNLDQFTFCHEVVLAYLDTFQTYSNMSLC